MGGIAMNPGWETMITVTLALLWIITAGLVVLVLATLRHVAFLYEKMDPYFKFQAKPAKLRARDALPPILLEDPLTGAVDFRQIAVASAVLVVQPSCRPCSDLLEAARDVLAISARGGKTPVLVVPGAANAAAKVRAEYNIPHEIPVLADTKGQTGKEWGIFATPTAIVLDHAGRMRKLLYSVKADDLRKALLENQVMPGEFIPVASVGSSRATLARSNDEVTLGRASDPQVLASNSQIGGNHV
jgi:hypothetical protein